MLDQAMWLVVHIDGEGTFDRHLIVVRLWTTPSRISRGEQ
jgi:hypothetical protein